MIISYKDKSPQIDPSAFVAPNATVIGDVVIGKQSSIWFQTVIRGDVNFIRIGDYTNIQDMSCLHVTKEKYPLVIGSNVSIGHKVTLHGCTLLDNSFVGIGATLLDGVEIGEYSFVGAGSLVTPNKKFPSRVMIMGSPAKVVREITDKDIEMIQNTALNYCKYKEDYKNIG